jgi:hypothetical protein
VADTVQPTLQVVNTKLHPLNKKALLYLVEFLRTFLAPEVEGRTKMNLANIATIFGPNLLRAPDAEVRALPPTPTTNGTGLAALVCRSPLLSLFPV